MHTCSRIAVICLIASGAYAQDIDVLARNVDGVIETAYYNRTDNIVVPTRTHAGIFPDANHSWNSPGWSVLSGSGGMPPSITFQDDPENARDVSLEWDVLPMNYSGGSSNLLYWDGVGSEPDFGLTPTSEYELTYYGIDGTRSVASGEDDLVSGGIIDYLGTAGGIHIHNFFFLDDNGDGISNTLPAEGFYLIAMRVRIGGLDMSDPEYVEHSDPFYIAWATPNADEIVHTDIVLPWVEERVDTLVLPGDHDFNGVVDAADYTIARDGQGTTHSPIDLTQWTENYGASSGTSTATAVPEPNSVALLSSFMLVAAAPARRWR